MKHIVKVAIAAALALGPITAHADTVLKVTEIGYDASNRPICVATRMDTSIFSLTSTPASACSSTSSAGNVNGPDRITKTTYDLAGQVLEIHRAVGTANEEIYATYGYTSAGLKAFEADANGNVTRYAYDIFDRLQTLYYPNPSGSNTLQPCAASPDVYNCTSTSGYAARTAGLTVAPELGAYNPNDYEAYTYDNHGNRLTDRRRNGVTISYGYDALNQLVLESVPAWGTTVAYTVATGYDQGGHVLARTYGGGRSGTVSYGYDSVGRVSSTTDMNNRTLSYQYDAASNRLNLTYPDNVVQNYGYYATNALSGIGVTGSTISYRPLYDTLGRVIVVQRSNSVVTQIGYDALDRVTSYGYAGFTTSSNNIIWSFSFNPASQIVSRTSSIRQYDYTEPTSSTDNRTYNGLNQDQTIVAMSGGYDANGNLANDGTRQFTYDTYNRLLSAVLPTGALTLTYDPEGRLSSYQMGSNAPTQFLYDGTKLIGEYVSGSMTMRYVHTLGVDQPFVQYAGSSVASSRASYIYSNYQGSVIALSDASGNVQQLFKYDPYGLPKNSANATSFTGSRFMYTGQIVLPDANLYYYKARVYDPTYERFLQTDPIGSKDDLDLYAYTGDDPVNRSDPTGLCGGGRYVPDDGKPCPQGQTGRGYQPSKADPKMAGGGVGLTAGAQAEVGLGKTGLAAQGSVSAMAVSDGKGAVTPVVAVTYAATSTVRSADGTIRQDSAVPTQNSSTIAAYNAGAGAGIVLTSAKTADDVRGAATTTTVTTPVLGLQYSENKSGVWTFSATVGVKGTGIGYTKQETNTVACSTDGCK